MISKTFTQSKITMIKKLFLFTAAILPLSFLALAGSPETKNNGKSIKESKAKLEQKMSIALPSRLYIGSM